MIDSSGHSNYDDAEAAVEVEHVIKMVTTAPDLLTEHTESTITSIIKPSKHTRGNNVCPDCDVELPHVPCTHSTFWRHRAALVADFVKGLVFFGQS